MEENCTEKNSYLKFTKKSKLDQMLDLEEDIKKDTILFKKGRKLKS